MNIVIFLVLIIFALTIGGAAGVFIGDWLSNKYLKKKDEILINSKTLGALFYERNCYRLGLKYGLPLEKVEKIIEDRE